MMSPVSTNRGGKPVAVSSNVLRNPVYLTSGHPAGANARRANNGQLGRRTAQPAKSLQNNGTRTAEAMAMHRSVQGRAPRIAASSATVASRRSPPSSAFVMGLGCASNSSILTVQEAEKPVKSSIRRSVSPSVNPGRKTVKFRPGLQKPVTGKQMRPRTMAYVTASFVDPVSEPISPKKIIRKCSPAPGKAKSHTYVHSGPRIPVRRPELSSRCSMAPMPMINDPKKYKRRSPLTIHSKRSPEPHGLRKTRPNMHDKIQQKNVHQGGYGDCPYADQSTSDEWLIDGRATPNRLNAQVEAYKKTLEDAEANYLAAKMEVHMKFQQLHSALHAQEEALLEDDVLVIQSQEGLCLEPSMKIKSFSDEYDQPEGRILVLHDRECDPMPIDNQDQACQTSGLGNIEEQTLKEANHNLIVTIQEIKLYHDAEISEVRRANNGLKETLNSRETEYKEKEATLLTTIDAIRSAHEEQAADLKSVLAELDAEKRAQVQTEARNRKFVQEVQQQYQAEKASWESKIEDLQIALDGQKKEQKEKERKLLDSFEGVKVTLEIEKSEWQRTNSLLKETIAVKDHEYQRNIERLFKTIQEIKKAYDDEKTEWEKGLNIFKDALKAQDRDHQLEKEKLTKAIEEIKLAHAREKADWERSFQESLIPSEGENLKNEQQFLRTIHEMKLSFNKEKSEWEGKLRDTLASKEREHQQEKEKFIRVIDEMKFVSSQNADLENSVSLLKETLIAKEKERQLEGEKLVRMTSEKAEYQRMNLDLRNALAAQDKQFQLKQQTFTGTIQAAKEALEAEKAEWEHKYSSVQLALANLDKQHQQKESKLAEMTKDLQAAREANRELLTNLNNLKDLKDFEMAEWRKENPQLREQIMSRDVAQPSGTKCHLQASINTQTEFAEAISGDSIGVQACLPVPQESAGMQISMEKFTDGPESSHVSIQTCPEVAVAQKAPEQATQVCHSDCATQTDENIGEPEPVEASPAEAIPEPSAPPLEPPDSFYFDYVMSHWDESAGAPYFPGPEDTPRGPFLSLTGAIPNHIMPLLEALATNAVFIQATSFPQQRAAFQQSLQGDEFHFAVAATTELAAALEVLAVNTGNPIVEEEFGSQAWPESFMYLMNELRSRLTQICLQREHEKRDFEEELDTAVQDHAQYVCSVEDQHAANLERIFITAERAKKACEDFRSAMFAQFGKFLKEIGSYVNGKAEKEINYKELFLRAKQLMEEFASGFAPEKKDHEEPNLVPKTASSEVTQSSRVLMADTNIAATIISQAKSGALECCITGVVGDLGLQALETIVANHDAALLGMRQSLAQIHNIQRHLKDTFSNIRTNAIMQSSAGDGQRMAIQHNPKPERSLSSTGHDTNEDCRSMCSSSCSPNDSRKSVLAKEKELVKLREHLRKRTEEKAGLNREIQSLRDSRKAALIKLDKLIAENQELSSRLSYMESIYIQPMPVNHPHHGHQVPPMHIPMHGPMGPNHGYNTGHHHERNNR